MAQHTPPSSRQASARRSKHMRLDHLNMGIAKTHRLATQLVGIQLSGANLLALLVSAASVVAGTVSLVAERYPFNWPLLLSAGVIGLGLALLIEGLTLGSLIRIRLANRAIREIEVRLESDLRDALTALAVPDLAQSNGKQAMRHYRQMRRLLQQESHQKRQQATRLHRQQRRFSLPLACMGALCSAIAGGLFYHTILAGLGSVESLVLAILFPLVITGTFVASEIQKDAQEDAIREGFSGGALTETAIRAETKLTSALAVHAQVLAYLEQPEAEQEIEEGARHLLTDMLAELRTSSTLAARQILITEEQENDTTRLLSAPQKQGDSLTGEGKATGDAVRLAPTAQGKSDTPQPDIPLTGDPKTGDKETRGDTRGDDATLPDDTISSRSVTSEESNTLCSGIHLTDDPRTSGGKATDSGTTRAERRSKGDGKKAEKRHPSVSDLRSGMPRSIRKDDMTLANKATEDMARLAVAPQREGDTTPSGAKATGDTTRQHVTPQEEDDTTTPASATKDDTTAEEATTSGQQPFFFSTQEQKAKETDTVTAQIFAYQAQHPHAKQAEIAAALGIAIRTLQRKLAAWKRQSFGQ